MARAMRGETADGIELYVRNASKPDGMFVSVSVRPLKDDGGDIKGGVAVVRDITSQNPLKPCCGKPRKRPSGPIAPRANSFRA